MKIKNKIVRRSFKFLGGTVLTLIIAAIAIPYFFKDELMVKLKTEINNNVRAEVDFKDVSLSLFRSFPDFNLRLKGLEVMGIEEFDGLRLAGMKKMDVSLDLMSVIKSDRPIEIKTIKLDEPNIYVKVLKNGTANYDIAMPSTDTTTATPTTEPSEFEISLQSYSVNNANIVYDDASTGMYLNIEDLTHKGKGNFTSTVYDLATKTKAASMTVETGGVAYLIEAKTDIDLTINIDMKEAKYTLKKNKVKINALELNLDGWVAMASEDINLDLKFSSPSTSFKDLLSMIPAAYTADFGKVKANGSMSLSGEAKGTYNENSMPAFKVNLKAENGDFQYPDLPMGMKNINTDISVNSPSSDFDKMVVNVSKFHVDLGNNPFDARFLLKTPLSDPYVDATVKGKIILDDLAKAFPLDEQGIETLTGIINADIKTKANMSAVTNEQYEKIQMAGSLGITNMNYVAAGMPKIVIKDMQSAFTPERLELKNFDANLGNSDLNVNGTFDNLLTYFSGEKTMKGNIVMRSNKFDVNEWMTTETTEVNENAPTAQIEDTTTAAGSSSTLPDRFDFNIDAKMGELVYDNYDIKDIVVLGHVTPKTMEFEDLSTKVGKSDFHIKGHFENAMGFAMNGETLRGTVLLYSLLFDADDLMEMAASGETTESSTATASAPKAETVSNKEANKESKNDIFGKFDLNTDVEVGQMKYDIYNITNLSAIGHIRHDKMAFNSFSANIGKSDISGSGYIADIFDYLYGGGTVSGDLIVNSNYIDADELIYGEEGATSSSTTTTTAPKPENPAPKAQDKQEQPDEVFGKFDIILDGNIKKMKYDVYTMRDMVVKGQLGHDIIRLDESKMYIGNSDIQMKGVINNAIDYMYRDAHITGQLDLKSKFLDVNQFMVVDESVMTEAKPEQPVATTTTTEMEPVLVPEGMDFVVNADLGKVLYSAIDLSNVKGKLLIQEQEIDMQDITADVFNGSMKINGKYETKDVDNPKFAFAYDISQFSIQDAFKKTNTIKKAAPIAKFIEGKLNSTFSINGILGKNMMPKWETLNGKGLLKTFETVVKGYKPFNDLSNKLKVADLKDITIKNSTNWFEIKDGNVELQPFDFVYKEMALRVGGVHGIDQDINYDIKVNIPRKKFQSNAAVALLDKGINLANSDAEFVEVEMKLTGNVMKPKTKIKNVNLGGKGFGGDKLAQEKDKVKNTADSLKNDAQKKLEAEIAKREAEAQARKDSLEKVLAEKIKKEQDKIAEELKKKAGDLGDKVGDKAKDEIGKVTDKVGDDAKKKAQEELEKLKVDDKAKEELEKLKNKIKIGNWGKKKKKDGN